MFDMILKNALIVDGTRAKAFESDVCIKDGKIAAVGKCAVEDADTILDLTGKVLAPGFIDIHSHSDASPLVSYTVESKALQGVTTEIGGNCGISILPSNDRRRREINDYFAAELEQPLAGFEASDDSITDYAQSVAAHGSSINTGLLIGHGTLRLLVMGFEDRDPTRAELAEMKDVLGRELERGAFGMSLGLIYPPSAYAKKKELVELAKVVKKHDGILSVHMRSEGPKIFEAVAEVLDIAEQSGVHLEISHLKLMGAPQWHRAEELLELIERSRSRGANVTCDQYPFNATSTGMSALVPHWAHAGGAEAMLRRLASREGTIAQEIGAEMANRGGPECVLVTGTHGYRPEYEGKTVAQLAAEMNLDPVDAVIRILTECKTAVACVYFTICEEDMLRIMKDMNICVGSDGYSFSLSPEIMKNNPHPRSYATFPRFLQIVREKKLMPLEDAVYKITGLPARILGMENRGVIKAGCAADITVFDAETVSSASDFLNSKVRPTGIEHVIVGGVFAVRGGQLTADRPGSVVLHRKSLLAKSPAEVLPR